MVRLYDMIEASTIDAQDITLHGSYHLGPQKMANVAVSPGAQVYPILLKANASGTLMATSEMFTNAAWKSRATVIAPASNTQPVVIGNILKSELQGLANGGNTYAFSADLQAASNTSTPYSIQLAVSNCAQSCNVFITLV